MSTFSDKELSGKSISSKGNSKNGHKPGSAMSISSEGRPINFKDERGHKPGSAMSISSEGRPINFKDERGHKPGSAMSISSEGRPINFKDERKAYGVPKDWGGRVVNPTNPHRFIVAPVLRTDHKAPDDFVHSRAKVRSANSSVQSLRTNQSPLRPDVGYSDIAESDTSDWTSTTSSGSSEEEITCDICSERKAVKKCLTCDVFYCELHVRDHYTVQALQRHTLRDVYVYVYDEVDGKRCPHYEESLDFLCTTDQMRICSICAQENHRGHNIISIEGDREIERYGSVKYHSSGPPETVVPPPGEIKFLTVKSNSVVLSWGCPTGLEGPKIFRVKWSSSTEVDGYVVIRDFQKIEINHLQLGQQYFFSVAMEGENGSLSEWVTASVFTAVPAPRHLTKGHSQATALSLKWTKGDNMEGIPHQFLVTLSSPEKEALAVHTKDCYKMFSDLEPDTEYIISVSTVLNDQSSETVSITIHTAPCLREVLSKVGLEDHYENKLTLSTVLEINQYDTSENKHEAAKSLPMAVLKKLMMLNVSCLDITDKSNAINPLDLIIALFLCSDDFLQQDIVLKMALCQMAVPLLLPNHETKEITLMLWSMREIVRTFRPSSQAFRKLSCEESIVLSDVPQVSFVRLGRMNLSKSQMLNKLLSNTQQSHNTFYHRNMVCSDVPRRISDGLVEISWYLPCGDRSVDKFTEPLAFTNLRGDIRAFDKQFSFLCQTSTAIYIFCDESEADYFKNLEGKDMKANIILISSVQGKTFTLKAMTMKPSIKTTKVSNIKKTDTELIKALQESISKMLQNCPKEVSVANLADRARCSGILVDEDSDECQSAWANVSKITDQVANTSEFKDTQLTSQGHIWKAISWLDTECWRLRKVGNWNTEEYRKSLKTKAAELRRKQQRLQMTPVMSSFLRAMVTSEVQRYYFLKRLAIDLDNLSRNQLSTLRDQYKVLSQKFSQGKKTIAEIDQQISVCSLRLDHFFRECGQLYECASYLPEYSHQRKTMEQLPALWAQVLLDGFPLELVDGDAANIPMKWITEVLTELHYIMQSNSKVKVITIIGAENSGKSTLLNTMFGLRFATSKGTCTRGAFIQLINVNKDVREELGCDCIMIIDTEGLKPHGIFQDDYSHVRDMEVASLAVALSDATIISISSDSSSEKDILEMVLHAVIRLMKIGTKPLCYFVHNNMSDMPAAQRSDSKDLVEEFNEIIQKDSKMKKAQITKVSNVMEFHRDSCSWHIPPIWHGTPPMAPVSVDYSETVHALKKQLFVDLKKRRGRGDLMWFIKKMEKLWKTS